MSPAVRDEHPRGGVGKRRPARPAVQSWVLARVISLAIGLALFILPGVVRAQCVPLDTSTFAGLKTGGCLTGGIATDAAGVSTPRTGDGPSAPMAFTASPKGLTLQIPIGATLRKAYLVVYAKSSGGFNGDPAIQVRLNGTLLSAAPEVDRNNAVGDGYRVYDVTTGFGITGSGLYAVEERGDADLNYQTGNAGVGGEQIVVVFDEPQHRQVRHIKFLPTFLRPSGGVPVAFDVTGLPTCGGAPTNAVISFSEMFECTDEQNGVLEFKPGGSASFTTLSDKMGGRDDGAPGLSGSCGAQDWNSLITAGSFGYDNNGNLVGVAGDSPTSEPAEGTANNSRLSDELYSTGMLDLSGILNVRFTGDGDQILTSTTVAIDLFDADCDAIVDASDNCPITPNPGQSDLDGDGLGDACDPTTCGNGVLEAGEGCDGGVTAAGATCSATCLVENGFACNANLTGVTGNASCASGICNVTGGAPGICEPANSCGNGVLEAGEGCDDGATATGDGCNASCLVEPSSACNTDPDGNTGANSCASGFCDPSGMCTPSIGVSGGGCSMSSNGSGSGAAPLLLLAVWAISALRRRRAAVAVTS